MSANTVTNDVSTAAYVVDDAVGVPETNWFVALVNHNTEKASAEKLVKMGLECYVPVQEEIHVWKNGRKKHVDRIVMPTIVFVRCTETERKEIVNLPYIFRFMTNKAGAATSSGNKPLAVIPDKEIQQLKFMVGNSDTPVTFKDQHYKTGDLVRVIRGKLAGLEGNIHHIDDKHSEIIVSLNCLGNACLTIETINVEPIRNHV